MGIRYNEKDYTGQRYGMLVAIRFTGKTASSPSGATKRIWLLRCDCGKEVEKTTQSLCNWQSKPEHKRDSAHCGCKNKHGAYSIAYEIYRAEYSDGDISFEKFLELSQQDCFHCGSKVCESGSNKVRRAIKVVDGKRTTTDNVACSFQYHGLDRIDNTKGHTLDNVVPCCWSCNNLRGSRELSKFMEHLNKIVKNYKNKHENLFPKMVSRT